MSHIELVDINICRYCCEGMEHGNLIKPCRCKGSNEFVHEECLKKWMEKRLELVNIPGYIHRYKISQCEICMHNYQIITQLRNGSSNNLFTTMFYGMTPYIIFLFGIYNLVGFGMVRWSFTHHIFWDNGETYLDMIVNGFIMTHLICGLLYVPIILRHACRNETGFYIICLPCTDNSSGFDDCCFMCIIMTISLLVIFSIAHIYIDIGYNIYQRYRNSQFEVVKILNFEPVEGKSEHNHFQAGMSSSHDGYTQVEGV